MPRLLHCSQATAEVTNLIVFNDCVNLYADSMQTSIATVDPYYKESEFMEIHQKMKAAALGKVLTLGIKEIE